MAQFLVWLFLSGNTAGHGCLVRLIRPHHTNMASLEWTAGRRSALIKGRFVPHLTIPVVGKGETMLAIYHYWVHVFSISARLLLRLGLTKLEW